MILTRLEELTAYRMCVPKWAVAPKSGAGAAMHGGRANRPGVPAIYLALDTETAVREYRQASALLPPGTLVSYQITVGDVADFRNGFEATDWNPIWDDFYCDWRELYFNQRIEPPSWVAGDEVTAAGAKGILFRSGLSVGGTNLVVYPGTFGAADMLSIFDPDQSLPKNRDSWP
ncbi:MAG: RES protein [Rhodospirillales bacterium RIFCSPLOWO2_12_FULL_58_28]|nr:MAG: RES protein [Rhodospirillales bacterium RIFCSPLOWO2_02_FULL_58_16]OHC77932.1 MAG: RES protein [Rhodospirillales bacterium RIFCSPLOWO2_12_FULL_58_28]